MTVTQETAYRTHIKILPQGSTQWEIPESLLPRPGGVYDGTEALTSVQITDDPTQPMEIVISRLEEHVATSENIFLFNKMMVFQKQYLQYVLEVPSGKLVDAYIKVTMAMSKLRYPLTFLSPPPFMQHSF